MTTTQAEYSGQTSEISLPAAVVAAGLVPSGGRCRWRVPGCTYPERPLIEAPKPRRARGRPLEEIAPAIRDEVVRMRMAKHKLDFIGGKLGMSTGMVSKILIAAGLRSRGFASKCRLAARAQGKAEVGGQMSDVGANQTEGGTP